MTQHFDREPLPRSPQLDAVIRAAREQPAPEVTVTVEDVRAASSARSAGRWWWGLAAVVIAGVSIWALQSRAASEVLEVSPQVDRVTHMAETSSSPPSAEPSRKGLNDSDTGMGAKPVLSGHSLEATVEPLGDANKIEPDERGIVALTDGRYRIKTAGDAMSVSVAGRVLEISAASDVVVDARVRQSSFKVTRGSAAWSETARTKPGPGAKELANQAEAALLAGRRDEAAEVLRKLVQAHPRGPVTKAALIDLARLEKRLGRPARAHCAYALFSKRFPTDARAPTVRQADAALGLSPGCRGLLPLSK